MAEHTGWRGSMTAAEQALFVCGMVAYVALLAGGQAVVEEDDPLWQRSILAAAVIAVAIATVGITFRAARRAGEVDRVVVSEATSWSFFATMIAALTYGLLEAITDAPHLSAWATWSFGMTAWIASSVMFRRRLF